MSARSVKPPDFEARAHELTCKQWSALTGAPMNTVYTWASRSGLKLPKPTRMPRDFPARAHEHTASEWAEIAHVEDCTVRRWCEKHGVRCRPAMAEVA